MNQTKGGDKGNQIRIKLFMVLNFQKFCIFDRKKIGTESFM